MTEQEKEKAFQLIKELDNLFGDKKDFEEGLSLLIIWSIPEGKESIRGGRSIHGRSDIIEQSIRNSSLFDKKMAWIVKRAISGDAIRDFNRIILN